MDTTNYAEITQDEFMTRVKAMTKATIYYKGTGFANEGNTGPNPLHVAFETDYMDNEYWKVGGIVGKYPVDGQMRIAGAWPFGWWFAHATFYGYDAKDGAVCLTGTLDGLDVHLEIVPAPVKKTRKR